VTKQPSLPLFHSIISRLFLSIYTRAHTCARTRTHAYTHTHTHTHTRTHAHAHTRTHICTYNVPARRRCSARDLCFMFAINNSKKLKWKTKMQILNPLCQSLAKIQIYVYAAKRVGVQIFINSILQAIVYTLTRHRKSE